MKPMKKQIAVYLWGIILAVVLAGCLITVVLQLVAEQRNAQEIAEERFRQVEQVLEENRQERIETEKILRNVAVREAETVAYMVVQYEDLPYNRARLMELAELLKLDEIHIFDPDGVIVAGTLPEVYGMTMADGQQISYFRHMLTDQNMELYQAGQPRTWDGKPMQYSAVWCEDGSYIVQVGRDPEASEEIVDTYALSHIFAAMDTLDDAALYAINGEGIVEGSTTAETIGQAAAEIGRTGHGQELEVIQHRH